MAKLYEYPRCKSFLVSIPKRPDCNRVVTAHFPCREKGGFFLPSLAATCHNDLWLACPVQPPILHKGDSRKY